MEPITHHSGTPVATIAVPDDSSSPLVSPPQTGGKLCRRRIYILVNGISNWPGNQKNWNKRGCTWIHLNLHPVDGSTAQCDEYFTTCLTVWIHEQDRSEVLAGLLKQFDGWEIIIIAHSNGTHIAVTALKIAHAVVIQELHLVSGAVDANFTRNGLDWAIHTGTVKKVCCYVAEKDWAMRLEDTLTGKALFGVYWKGKPLGYDGPTNVNHLYLQDGRVQVIRKEGYGHSTWFEDKYFADSMRLFTAK